MLKRERQVLVKEKARTRAGVLSPSRHSASALNTTTLTSIAAIITKIIAPVGRGDE
jgi:hypothetical protein